MKNRKNPFFKRIISSTTLKQDYKNLVSKIANKTHSEITAKLLDPEMSCAFLTSVKPSFKSEKKEESQL
jgi:hypothetical protein